MNSIRINVPRLIALATVVLSVVAIAAVAALEEPEVDALRTTRLDQDAQLQSDRFTLASLPRLRRSHAALAATFATRLRQSAEAEFLRDLASATRRAGLDLLTTELTPAPPSTETPAGEPDAPLRAVPATIRLRGPYRKLLATIDGLSFGNAMVEVRQPSLRRDGTSVVATIPIVLYEPMPRRAAITEGESR